MSQPSRAFLSLGLVSAGIIICTGAACAEPPQEEYHTPKQPWSDYTVHQMSRPHPEKVTSKGAVCTKAPAGAIVLFDGKDTAAFTRAWTVKDGVMIASPHPKPKA